MATRIARVRRDEGLYESEVRFGLKARGILWFATATTVGEVSFRLRIRTDARIGLMDASAPGIRMTHQGYFLRVPERGVHALTSYITEDKDLFLLAHMGLAAIDPLQWKLQVSGLAMEPALFSLADLNTTP